MTPTLALVPLLAPLALFAAAAVALRDADPQPRRALAATRWASLFALALAVLAGLLVALHGPVTSTLLGFAGLGIAVRLDALSALMLLVVSSLGVVVVQYSRNYLAGDARHGAFLGGMALALGAVSTLMLAGNLLHLLVAWVGTSLALQRLLSFYGERQRARLAAHKKFLFARGGDACLLSAAVLLYTAFGSADIATIAAEARETLAGGTTPTSAVVAAALLAAAALVKSAQFPVHGWLPEVAETPTPVSALLHAGIINAGGFLVIRLADVMLVNGGSLQLLVLVGGFSALFASLVMLTQTNVKGSLAWSTIAQMGFMLLQCGLGAFSAAALHIAAHSFYKAHAFLSAGGVVRRPHAPLDGQATPVRPVAVVLGLAAAVALSTAAAAVTGISLVDKPAVITLAALLVMALGHLLACSISDRTDGRSFALVTAGASAFALAYFLLHVGAGRLLAPLLPQAHAPAATSLLMMAVVLLGFGALALAQLLGAGRTMPRWLAPVRVHIANGLYVNAACDRLLGALRYTPTHTSAKETAQ